VVRRIGKNHRQSRLFALESKTWSLMGGWKEGKLSRFGSKYSVPLYCCIEQARACPPRVAFGTELRMKEIDRPKPLSQGMEGIGPRMPLPGIKVGPTAGQCQK
jgi:hypothetical protein